ncbi:MULTISPECIES: MarR family winged helix-turn-helix transcriptional regulator [unclassified Streptomyces]|uniref:MarR family winged helix-turn-helix transcriptional regulator n=1 Tax=unclassified Streptomyces TaxID=2593676 RepID=UPI0024B876A8|nr:MarR family transcriptional regulator [Streptomyces sp. KAU_LT]MDI9833119.1 MarR family transcriptional regulator [Streptomyces sp. KAU_LT]
MGGRRRAYPTTEELRIWRDFIETAQALRTELAARLQKDSSLSPGDYATLLALSEADGGRLRPSALARTLDWERSRLSHQLGRMERRGLVRREECATDSRGAEVVLTDEGARAFRAAALPHLLAIRELFVAALAPEQIAALGDAVRALRAGPGARRDDRPRAAGGDAGSVTSRSFPTGISRHHVPDHRTESP